MGILPLRWVGIALAAGAVLGLGLWYSRHVVYAPPDPPPPSGFTVGGVYIAMPCLEGMRLAPKEELLEMTKSTASRGPSYLLGSSDSASSIANDLRRDLAEFYPVETEMPGGSIRFVVDCGQQRLWVSVDEASSDFDRRLGKSIVCVQITPSPAYPDGVAGGLSFGGSPARR